MRAIFIDFIEEEVHIYSHNDFFLMKLYTASIYVTFKAQISFDIALFNENIASLANSYLSALSFEKSKIYIFRKHRCIYI